MNRNLFLTIVVAVVLMQSQAFAQSQSQELPKFEVAAEFTTLEREAGFGRRTEPGFGGRFTFNLNKVFSLESAGYFLPKRCLSCRNNGRITEALGGVKVGKRFENWGIFVKARPGVISFSEGNFDVRAVPVDPTFPLEVERSRLTTFAMDLGGVIEFYPSKRIVTRFDAGDTLIHFNRRTSNIVIFEAPNTFRLVPFTTPGRTTHNFQFMASVGFRF